MIDEKPTEVELEEHHNVVWHVTPARDTTIEDMLKSNYWAHVAYRFRAGDRVIAVPDDRGYRAEFYVLAKAKQWAKVVLLRKDVLIEDTEDTVVNKEYIVKWQGKAKWSVLQGNEYLIKGLDTKEEAEAWLKDHLKEIA